MAVTSSLEMAVPNERLIFSKVMTTSVSFTSTVSTDAVPATIVPPANSWISSAACCPAVRIVATLMPFSKRELDSLRKLNLPAVLRIKTGLNNADSNATVTVPSVISESIPPMTPAKAIGAVPFVMTMLSVSNVLSTPSRVVIFSLALARRTMISFEPI
ncbi:hypothetical protein SDC9_126136 [bioreactor metagenome]|uniref:Uncharacterized protein n=1 Tax=bioreactor metagenome TaxID=1076179 RepID=A0A645CQC9_9ZZZZ